MGRLVVHRIRVASQPVCGSAGLAGYGDTPLGWDLSAENGSKEWIEIRFATSVYVSGFELYETYKPGALYRISSAVKYKDDNTIACCGADAQRRASVCNPLPTCSQTTWNAIWEGTAANSGDKATKFEPPVCPYAYQTDVISLDLDTVAASGWNNFDAAKLLGSIDFP